MNRATAFCFFLFFLADVRSSTAQQVSFIHIQTENNQYYEVDWNGKTFTASQTGYLVVSQVPPGKQSLIVRFSPESSTEYNFMVEMTDKPKSFSLRQSIDNSWSLFDLVDLTLQKGEIAVPAPKISKQAPPAENETKAVVMDKPSEKKSDKPEEKTKEKPAEIPVAKTDPPATRKEKPSAKLIGITKIFDKSGSTGIDQVYILTNGAKSDTIALFIPNIEPQPAKTGTNPPAAMLPSGKQPIGDASSVWAVLRKQPLSN